MIYSPDLLRLMGTNIASGYGISETHVCNEQKLMETCNIKCIRRCTRTVSQGIEKQVLNKCDAHYLDCRLQKTLNRSVGGLVGNQIMLDTDITKALKEGLT